LQTTVALSCLLTCANSCCAASPGSLPQQLAGARPPKRRKLVDRRASKGRKIRYHTMDKLVGFMAPAELVPPPFAEQLFGNLFSHQG
jgi:hypothetical protein